MAEEDRSSPEPRRTAVHPLIHLAREAVEAFVRERTYLEPPDELTAVMAERAGVFVCLKQQGRLRGCIGTFEPVSASVAEETIQNAISAATRDPRFPPVSEEELPFLTYSVDILTQPEQVTSIRELDPKRYGVIVRCGSRRGLLLPDLEGVDAALDQVRIARQKASISANESVELYRFEVRRFE